MKKYKVRLVLEKWENGKKICDEESTLIGEHRRINNAMHLWALMDEIIAAATNGLNYLFGHRFEKIK